MKNPSLIEFHSDSFKVLVKDLLAISPNEGCALLVGDKKERAEKTSGSILRIHFVWPCCNIWSDSNPYFRDLSLTCVKDLNKQASKENRFFIDPREQIHAQRWARERNWKVLGSAHSHPLGSARPSKIDIEMLTSEELMIIMNKDSDIRVWWVSNNQKNSPQELDYIISSRPVQ